MNRTGNKQRSFWANAIKGLWMKIQIYVVAFVTVTVIVGLVAIIRASETYVNDFDVSVSELIAWGVTLVSVTLLINQRRDRSTYYAMLTGLLDSGMQMSNAYALLHTEAKNGDIEVLRGEDYLALAARANSDMLLVMLHVRSYMLAIEPDKIPPNPVNMREFLGIPAVTPLSGEANSQSS